MLETKTIYKSTKRLYLNADKTQIVPEGSPEACYLLAPAGYELDYEVAERYGLTQESEEVAAVPAGETLLQSANKAILQAPESKPFSSASFKKAKPQ